MARRGSASTAKESEEVEAQVDDYPERPYSEVITDEHREFLKEQGVKVEDAAAVSESVEE